MAKEHPISIGQKVL